MRIYVRSFSIVGAFVVAGALLSAPAALAAAPVLTKISPNNGATGGGTSVAIAGTGFVSVSSVKFGSTASSSVTVNSSTSITAIAPSGSGLVNVTVTTAEGTSAVTPYDQFGYDSPSGGAWLGLNDNSDGAWSGGIGDFVAHNITYDRGGSPGIEWTAGELAEEGGKITARGEAIAKSLNAGMVPDIVIEYGAYNGTFKEDPNFPTEAGGSKSLKEYVEGFVASAVSILKEFPGSPILFEPMNEPWGYTTPQYNALQYANVLAKLLPAAKEAHIPAESIYVAAFGANCLKTESKECTTNGWVPALYAAQSKLETEIQGWYFHPYGPPTGTEFYDSGGIQSLPPVQGAMTSGQNNIIVSEVGYCVLAINPACNAPYVATQAEGEKKLSEMLHNALPYHEAGWLKALIVYARSDGGWAMQQSGSKLTNEGEALDKFGDFYGLSWVAQVTPNEGTSSSLLGVACVSSTACDASGRYSYTIRGCCNIVKAIVEHWNGTEWIIPPNSGSAGSLNGLSCLSSTDCVAVGETPPAPNGTNYKVIAEIWNGTEWNPQATPEPVGSSTSDLLSVSCPTSLACSAVGGYINGASVETTLVEQWNGTEWSTRATPNPSEATKSWLAGVSCVSSTACIAVGSYKNSSGATLGLSELWNGSEWTIGTVSNPSSTVNKLTSVKCLTSSNCIAVGEYSTGGVTATLIEKWNGTEWTVQSTPNPSGATESSLNSVSCVSSIACTAVGSYKNSTGSTVELVERWNGTEWAIQTIQMPLATSASRLNGVTCLSVVVCVSVGSSTGTKTTTLAERYG